MHTIGRQGRIQSTGRIGHGRVVIQVHQPLCLGILLERRIQGAHLRRRFDAGHPRVLAHRQHRGQHHGDAVRTGQLHHRVQVVLDHRLRAGPGVARDIVGAGKDEYHLRLQSDDVLAEAQQHLRRGLPADAAVEVALAGEERRRIFFTPALGDRIAVEQHAWHAGLLGRYARVGLAVAGQLGPVGQALLQIAHLIRGDLVDRFHQQWIDRLRRLRLHTGRGHGQGQGGSAASGVKDVAHEFSRRNWLISRRRSRSSVCRAASSARNANS